MVTELVALVCIAFFASIFRGVLGIFALVFAPLALLVIDAKVVVLIGLFLGMFSCVTLLVSTYKDIDWSMMKPLFFPA